MILEDENCSHTCRRGHGGRHLCRPMILEEHLATEAAAHVDYFVRLYMHNHRSGHFSYYEVRLQQRLGSGSSTDERLGLILCQSVRTPHHQSPQMCAHE